MHSHGFGYCDCSSPIGVNPADGTTANGDPHVLANSHRHRSRKLRVLAIALVLVASFSAVELKMGQHSHSLSLLADAGHLVADVFAIAMSLLAAWIAQWPSCDRAPFGYRRVEILAALVNSIGLIAISSWIGLEAITHLQQPPVEILTQPMIWTAIAGLGVNGINAFFLHDHAGQDLNVRGAFLHLLADALSCLGVLVGAIAIAQFHWLLADSIVSLMIALLIFAGAIPLLVQSLSILLEQAPANVNTDMLKQRLLAQPGVTRLQQIQVWTIAPGQVHLCAQLVVTLPTVAQRDTLLSKIQAMLAKEFGIQAVTVQMVATPEVALSMLPNARMEELI
jgi:cobalt-zinc-cadmium efflux system protein